jgi:serine/threonine-protein kinase
LKSLAPPGRAPDNRPRARRVIPKTQTIGDFRVVEKVRQGSVGTVYKVADLRGKIVALKLISESNSQRPDKVKKFKREAKLGQRMDHPNIVRVYDFYDNGGRPFFTMEYFHSESLKLTISNMPERVKDREFFILRQVAEALAYLHAQGIVHKDLKPENILVNEHGDVRLIDLSLAQDRWDHILGLGRKIEGTPVYMAPEQILGRKIDARTDIYAFGAVAFELIAKRVLFTGTSQQEIFRKHLGEAPTPLRHVVPHIANSLDVMVLKCLEKDPEARWPDMTHILFELGRREKEDTVQRARQVVPPKAEGSN